MREIKLGQELKQKCSITYIAYFLFVYFLRVDKKIRHKNASSRFIVNLYSMVSGNRKKGWNAGNIVHWNRTNDKFDF